MIAMWDVALIGVDRPALDSEAGWRLEASSDARIVLIGPPGVDVEWLHDLPSERIELPAERDVAADVAAIAAHPGLIELLDRARSPIVVDAFASPWLALAVELAAGALRLDGISGARPARIRANEVFAAALAAVVELLDANAYRAAQQLLGAVTAVAAESGDGLSFSLADPLEMLDLAARHRVVPRDPLAHIALTDDLLDGAWDFEEGAVVDAAGTPAGAGALAWHAFAATTNPLRREALAAILAAWGGVLAEPLDDLLSRVRAASGEDERLRPESDPAAQLAALARKRLVDPEFGADPGTYNHLIVTEPNGMDAQAISGRFDDIVIADETNLHDALGARVFAGDGVHLLVPERPRPVDRVVLSTCLNLWARVREIVAVTPGGETHRTELLAAIVAARKRALSQLIARRAASSGDIETITILERHLPDGVDPGRLELARRLRHGLLEAQDLGALRAAGVATALVDGIERKHRLPGPARRLLGRWPDLRRRLRGDDPLAVAELADLLSAVAPEMAGRIRLAVAAAHARVADASVADVATALGVASEDPDEVDVLVEERIAKAIGVDANILGGPDPVVSLLVAVREPTETAADLFSSGSPWETRLALAEARVHAHPDGLWVIDSALAAVEGIRERGFTDMTDDPLVSLAARRAGAALDRLLGLPEQVLDRGSFNLRTRLLHSLEPLREWFGDQPEGESYDTWRNAWIDRLMRDAPRVGEAARERVLLAAERRIPVARDVVESGLVEPDARAIVDKDAGTAEILLRGSLASALYSAREAWTRAQARARSDEIELQERRARIVLETMLRGRAALDAGRRWDVDGPALPEVWLQHLDARTGAVIERARFRLDDDGKLRASLREAHGALRVALAGDAFSAYGAIADAMLADIANRPLAAAALAHLAAQLQNAGMKRALLAAAVTLLLADASAPPSAQLAQARGEFEQVGGQVVDLKPLAAELSSVAAQLTALCAEERQIVAQELVTRLDEHAFAALVPPDRESRLSAMTGRVQLREHLDRLLP
jgi:hypothetical protein